MQYLKISFVVLLLLSMIACTPNKKVNQKKETDAYSLSFEVPDSVAYSIGLSMGNYLQQQGIRSLDFDAFGNGMKAGLTMTESHIDSISMLVQTFMMEKGQEIQYKMQTDTNYIPEPFDLSKEVSFNFAGLLGNNLVMQNLNKMGIDNLMEGVKANFDNTSKYSIEISRQILENYFINTDSLRVQLNEQYLADHKAKKGVITTESGLQYEILTEGTGAKPSETTNVKVHYKGTFINGKTFDSSYDRNEPATFPLNQVIPGWTEGVQLMAVGSKYKFTIPHDLAYGETGNQNIPPKSTLIFEVELLEIVE